MRMMLAGLAALTLVGACATTGPDSISSTRAESVFVARNHFRVTPTPDPNRFVVRPRGGGGASFYFCAAGEYARRRLGASAADRVVVIAPQGSFDGLAVGFELMPQGTIESSNSITLRVNRVGESLRVAHAQSLCRQDILNVVGTS